MRNKLRLAPLTFLLFFLLVSLPSCASFRAGNLQASSTWPLTKETGKRSITLLVSGKVMINQQQQDMRPNFLEKWQEHTVKAYSDSGLFDKVQVGPAETDLRADVQILNRGEANQALAFLSGFTMFLVPGKAYDEFVVKTAIRNREGKILASLEKSEAMTTWFQLFLVFAMPFNFPGSVGGEVLYDINRSIISEAHAKGAL